MNGPDHAAPLERAGDPPQHQQQAQGQNPRALQKHDRVRVQALPPTSLMPDGIRAYTPLKLIGDGSFGTVWLCDWHSPLPPGTPLSPMQCGQGAKLRPEWTGKRLVAVKRLNRRWNGGWDECCKLKELESLRRISPHASIIPLYDAFLLPSSLELYFVFESMEGNLYQLIKARKTRPFAAGLIASIFKQTIAGLEHMHDQGYFHRDMKPENLLVTTTGVAEYGAVPGRNGVYRNGTSASQGEKDVQVIVKLADFGLAREILSEPPYTEYVSTRWYRAPEILLRATDYSAPVDLWAFGTIMAELVNLRPLFPGSGELDQLGKLCDMLGDFDRDYAFDERGVPIGGGAWPRAASMLSRRGYHIDARPPVDFTSLFEPYVSPILVQCIADLLKYDPARRPTAAQVVNHQYMQETAHVLPPHIVPGAMPAAPPPHTLNHSASQSSLERHMHVNHSQGFGGTSQMSLPLTQSQTQLMHISPMSPRSLPPSHSHSPAFPKPAFPTDLPTPQTNGGPSQQGRLPPFYPPTPSPSSSHMSPQSTRSQGYNYPDSQPPAGRGTANELIDRIGEMDIDLSYPSASGVGDSFQAQQAELWRQKEEAELALLRQQQEAMATLKRQFEEKERALVLHHQQQAQAQAQALAQQQAAQHAQHQHQQASKGWGLFGHSDKGQHLSQEELANSLSNPNLRRPPSGSGSTGSFQEPSQVGVHPPVGPYGHVMPPAQPMVPQLPQHQQQHEQQHQMSMSLPPLPAHQQQQIAPQLVIPPPLQHQHSHGSNGSSSKEPPSKKDERKAKEDARRLDFEKKQRLQRERARAQLAKRNQLAAPNETGWNEWDSGKTQMALQSNPSIHAVLNGSAQSDPAALAAAAAAGVVGIDPALAGTMPFGPPMEDKGKQRSDTGPALSTRSLGRAAASVRTYSSLQEAEERHAELQEFEARIKARRRDGDGDHSMSSSDLLSVRSGLTQHSDYSDPGPSHTRYNQFRLRGTISTSSLRTNSSLPPTNHAPTQTYGQITPLESQFISDFSNRAKVGSPDMSNSSSTSTFAAPPSSFKMGLPPISALPLNDNQMPMYGLPVPVENGNGQPHPMFRVPPHHLSPLSSDMDQDEPEPQQTVLPPFSELLSFSPPPHSSHQQPG